MPAEVIPIRRPGTYMLPEAAPPARPVQPIGALWNDPARNRSWVRVRASDQDIADPEQTEVPEALGEDIRDPVGVTGAQAYRAWLEDSLSNVVCASERRPIEVDSFTRVLDQLLSKHVEPPELNRFETHLPLYTLYGAAGKLGEEMEVEPADWVLVPAAVRHDPEPFVTRAVGHSIEPPMPDGSLNRFRFRSVGLRVGKSRLIRRFCVSDETARYAVKRSTSEEAVVAEWIGVIE